MRQITQDELNEILRKHALWLGDEDGGERADFSHTNLKGFSFKHKNLKEAYFKEADLSNANFYDANIGHVDFSNANLSDACFHDVDLRYATFNGANLSGTRLWNAAGDMTYIKSTHLDRWHIAYTSDVLQIGCKQYPIEDWWKFSDEEIAEMNDCALEWWKKYKPLIKQIIETSPAKPTGWKAA